MSRPPEFNPPPAVESSAAVRAVELHDLSRRLARTAERLPGQSAKEHRQLVGEAFGELAQILPMLYGPDAPGTFRHQLRVVESARSQLAALPQGLAVEPTIGSGLRAAHDALRTLASRSYFEQERLVQTMDRLNATINSLDTARGPAHQAVVADTLTLMSDAMLQMTEALGDRLASATAPSTQPAPDR